VKRNRPKKQCSKAKREREILHDLEVINRRLGILAVTELVEHTEDLLKRTNREQDQLHAAEDKLEQELHDLWTIPPIKKQRARQREGHL
jgi:hypothetical protein